MPRPLVTIWLSLILLLSSPSLHLPNAGWVEVGAPPAAAEPVKAEKKKPVKKPAAKVTRKPVGSSTVVISTQPGFHPMQTIAPPKAPEVTGTVTVPKRMLEYPNVPTVPAIIPETSQDRVARCTHQGALGGLSPSEQGTYIHKCAF